jgi:hypothetical protein
MALSAHVHDAHGRHLGGQPRAPLPGEKPPALGVVELTSQRIELVGVDPWEQLRYFGTNGQPRP